MSEKADANFEVVNRFAKDVLGLQDVDVVHWTARDGADLDWEGWDHEIDPWEMFEFTDNIQTEFKAQFAWGWITRKV